MEKRVYKSILNLSDSPIVTNGYMIKWSKVNNNSGNFFCLTYIQVKEEEFEHM